MKKCNKISHTCGTISYALCTTYETPLPEFSELGDCVSIEQTTEELYNLVGEIKEETDLSELGNECLEYVLEEGKVIVKNVLLKHEEEICLLKNRVTELENRPICDMSLGDCIDTSCLTDPCGDDITTWGQLIQILVNNNCETP